MLARRLARPMLAAIFISGGIDALRTSKQHADLASPVPEKTAKALPFDLPSDPEQLVKIDGAVKVVAGSLLALGRLPRIAAIALAGSLVPTTLAAHRFWEEHDPGAREQQQIHFYKNLGLLGGLMLAAVDTEAKPSLGWWARRGISSAADSTRSAAHAVAEASPF